MKIAFYYFGHQCPFNSINIENLRSFCKDKQIALELIDITNKREVAKALHIYSPNLCIVNDHFRWNGPISLSDLSSWYNGDFNKRSPYIADGHEIISGDLRPIDYEGIIESKALCCYPSNQHMIKNKKDWFEKEALAIKGYYHYVDGSIQGGVELMLGKDIPYDLQVNDDAWVITCLFGSDSKYDYKTKPLQSVEDELRREGVKEVFIVASKDVCFPNGPMSYLEDLGYKKVRYLAWEENDHAELFLMKKPLKG